MRQASVWLPVAIAWGLASTGTAAADAPFPETQERLVELARVWAKVKFLHPYLAYKDVDWDAALLAAIPRVEAATTDAAYRAAVADMLKRLGDPLTRVEDAAPAPSAAPPAGDWLATPAPGIVAIDLAAFIGAGWDYPRFQQQAQRAIAEGAKAKVLVVDLRVAADRGWMAGQALEYLDGMLPAVDEWPLQRHVEHRGYRTQHGMTSGSYYSTFVTTGALPPKPAPQAGPRHVVFVADATSPIPPVVLGLQAAGRGTVVAAGALSEEGVTETTRLPLARFSVQIRLGELLWGPPAADVRVVPKADARARALALAKTLAGAKPAATRRRSPPLAALPPLRARDDADYADAPLPSRPLRQLAGIRAWAVLEYFFPYRYLVADWDGALRDALPKLAAATDRDGYLDALRELAARAGDGHVGVRAVEPAGAPPRGLAPFEVRIVETRLVVVEVLPEAAQLGIRVGDVIESIDGTPWPKLLADRRRVTSGSTDEARDQRVAMYAFIGEDGTTQRIGVRGATGPVRELTITRKAAHGAALGGPGPGPHWKLLPNQIGYANLVELTAAEVPKMFADLAGTRALVLDLRGYPKGTAWSIAPRINTRQARHGAQFLQPLVGAPADGIGDFRTRFLQHLPALPPGASIYRGTIVVLVDDRAISQAEHSCLFFQEAAGATFIGSPTAGANGDVTTLRLPGGLRMTFTGQEVRHVDGKQLQKVGILPHVLVRPTIAGIRSGKDEVLDRALAWLATGK